MGITDVLNSVNEIVMEVGEKGDEALFKFTEKFEGARLDELRVGQEEIDAAYDLVEDRLKEALADAADNIFHFHRQQKDRDLWLTEVAPGVTVGQKTVPLDSVGAYVPGGRASYPSSALMNVIPAKVADVGRIVVCTPPKSDGSVTPLTLVAADMAGADEIYKLGGAQAIAAMGLGTESVERVQKIVGPGNVYVTAAKMLLRGSVEIDFPAGPSEVLILADRTADPGVIAADMIAQGEHDPRSISVLVTTDDLMASAVIEELSIQATTASRSDIIQQSLEHSAVLLAVDMDEALDFCNAFAPEHLEIITADPMGAFRSIRNAGKRLPGQVHTGSGRRLCQRHQPCASHLRICQGFLGPECGPLHQKDLSPDDHRRRASGAGGDHHHPGRGGGAEGTCRVGAEEAGAEGVRSNSISLTSSSCNLVPLSLEKEQWLMTLHRRRFLPVDLYLEAA